MLDIVRVGLDPAFVPYTTGWERQRAVHAEVVAGDRDDTLLLLEHEEVYTAGTRTLPAERPADGTPVIDVDRGGKITWHGPGQLVGYPIIRLGDPVDVVAHVRNIEQVLIDVISELGVDAHRIAGRTGVWVSGPVREEKVAAIGVRVSQSVTMHGFALNCDNTLAGFDAIVPCGIRDAGVTTLSRVLGHTLRPIDVVDAVAERFTTAAEAVAA